jgi:dTMP kinase
MTDDRIVRMLRVSKSDPVQQEAADEIERLIAERDEQKRRADYLSKDFDRDIKMYQAEVAELRTNLAAANARAEDAEQRLRVQEKWIGRAEAAEASYATLRLLYEAAEADLAAANARVAEEERAFQRYIKELDELTERAEAAEAELAATRAALQYARNLIGPDEIIDAALKGNE